MEFTTSSRRIFWTSTFYICGRSGHGLPVVLSHSILFHLRAESAVIISKVHPGSTTYHIQYTNLISKYQRRTSFIFWVTPQPRLGFFMPHQNWIILFTIPPLKFCMGTHSSIACDVYGGPSVSSTLWCKKYPQPLHFIFTIVIFPSFRAVGCVGLSMASSTLQSNSAVTAQPSNLMVSMICIYMYMYMARLEVVCAPI